MTIPVRFLTALITLYQWTLSPFIGRHCRFLPTCSQYAHEAIRVHGALRGCLLAARRLARCHPWGGSGFDPVPPRSPAAPSGHRAPPPPSSSPSPLHRPG